MIKIGNMAKICGVSAQTLRYYDAEGVLRPEATDKNTGYRLYSPSDIEKFRKIQFYKSLGFELNEIKELFTADGDKYREMMIKRKNAMLKKNGPLLRSVFRTYPEYDIELTAGGRRYGVKFFPKYLKNKNLLIQSETRACLLKNTGVMGITRRGSLPGASTLAPNVIHEVIGRTFKIDLTGADADVSILIFSPGCKRIYYVNKTARAEAYNGDDVFGYKVFYKKDSLAAFLEKQ